MSYPINFGPVTVPSIPIDNVKIEVELDLSLACSPSLINRLSAIQTNGITVPISQIIAFSALHFQDAIDDFYGIGITRSAIKLAWENIASWRPRAVLRARDSVSKLTFDQRANSRVQALVTELIGVGVGVIAASHVFQIPFQFWHPTPKLGPTDFCAPGLGGEVHVECRGRFGRGGWQEAKEQVYKKFFKPNSFSSQLGTLVSLNNTPNTRSPDLVLIDPPGEGLLQNKFHLHRAMLRHYAPFFAGQRKFEFANRLHVISEFSDSDFERYLSEGDETLYRLRGWGSGRTSFTLGNVKFWGTAWEADSLPFNVFIGDSQDTTQTSGYAIFGLANSIILCLAKGELENLIDAQITPWQKRDEVAMSFAYYVFEDGTAIAWAPSIEALLELP